MVEQMVNSISMIDTTSELLGNNLTKLRRKFEQKDYLNIQYDMNFRMFSIANINGYPLHFYLTLRTAHKYTLKFNYLPKIKFDFNGLYPYFVPVKTPGVLKAYFKYNKKEYSIIREDYLMNNYLNLCDQVKVMLTKLELDDKTLSKINTWVNTWLIDNI